MIPAPITIGAAVLAAAAQWWFWRRTALAGTPRLGVLALRLGAIALLAWILTGPEQPILKQGDNRKPAVLTDISRSMEYPGEGGTRAQQALAVTRRLTESAGAAAVQFHSFGSRLVTGAADDQARAASLPATALRGVLTTGRGAKLPQGILLISDGAAQDEEELLRIAKTSGERGVPVSVLCTGGTMEVKNASLLGLDAPRRVKAGALVPVTVTAKREGITEPLVLELVGTDNKVIDRATLGADAAEASTTFNVTAGPNGFSGRLRISAVEGEMTLADNEVPLEIGTENATLRVLYMEGSTNGNYGQPEPLFLCQALAEHGDIEVDLLSLNALNTSGGSVLVGWPWKSGNSFRPDTSKGYPATKEELNRYDVIICSDIPRAAFTPEQIQWTADLVAERGAGFIMIGGNTSFGSGMWDRTVWEKLIPLDMDGFSRGFYYQDFLPFWPETAKRHPLLAGLPLEKGETLSLILEAHPEFHGTNFIRRAKPAATVIMQMNDESGVPIMAVQPFGKGRSMAFTSDVTYLWGTDHNRNWGPPETATQNYRSGANDPFGQGQIQQFDQGPQTYNNSYYRRFWHRTVRWLAENSIRVKGAQFEATTPFLSWPGSKPLPVFAAGPDESMMTRLSGVPCVAQVRGMAGTRTRLKWDEAAHRFAGSIPRAQDLPEEVIIDVEARDPLTREMRSASLTVRAPRVDAEAAAPSARPDLMAAVAAASGGKVLHSASEASAWLAGTVEAAAEPSSTGRMPAWDRTWVLVAVLLLLSAEWVIRRFYT